ncbi:MAG TPA: DUF4238 domain-containing protein [Pyrinomonadaceae bacterium]|nr:DUF4238 domain-containing protein [Pyrinomonadaceae bacterium]
MASYTKQHFVPQNSLRRFTHDGEHLFVFDKFTQEVRGDQNVKDIAEERHFNRIPVDELPPEVARNIIDPDGIERALGAIESDYNDLVGKILQASDPRTRVRRILDAIHLTSPKCFNRKQKEAMSFFIALQYIRTREFRNFMAEGAQKFAEAVMKFVPREQRDEFAQVSNLGTSKNRKKLSHLNFIVDPDVLSDYSDVLYKHIWVIGLNHTPHALYSSDHPVVRLPHVRRPFRGNMGIACRGIEIALPLSSKHILFLRERSHFKSYEPLEGRCIELSQPNVECYNSLQVTQSHRQVYCENDDFDLARDICARSPRVSSPLRDRITVN